MFIYQTEWQSNALTWFSDVICCMQKSFNVPQITYAVYTSANILEWNFKDGVNQSLYATKSHTKTTMLISENKEAICKFWLWWKLIQLFREQDVFHHSGVTYTLNDHTEVMSIALKQVNTVICIVHCFDLSFLYKCNVCSSEANYRIFR